LLIFQFKRVTQGYFLTKIFHPNVSKAGEICINTLKKDWNPNLGLGHIFLTIKCLLIAPNPESALNEEAGKQLLEDYDSFAKNAKLMTSIHATLVKVDFNTQEVKTEGLSLKKEENEENNEQALSPKKRGITDKPKSDIKKRTLRRL
jgi:ubiquitin-conjugating enzyme E2 S